MTVWLRRQRVRTPASASAVADHAGGPPMGGWARGKDRALACAVAVIGCRLIHGVNRGL
jgi:hypothetical protein